MRLLLAVLLASSAVAQTPPVLDRAGLDPVLSRSWTAGDGCGADLMDFVIDTDGQPYIRNNGFTPLSGFTLQGSVLTTTDDVGIGRSIILAMTAVCAFGRKSTIRPLAKRARRANRRPSGSRTAWW